MQRVFHLFRSLNVIITIETVVAVRTIVIIVMMIQATPKRRNGGDRIRNDHVMHGRIIQKRSVWPYYVVRHVPTARDVSFHTISKNICQPVLQTSLKLRVVVRHLIQQDFVNGVSCVVSVAITSQKLVKTYGKILLQPQLLTTTR